MAAESPGRLRSPLEFPAPPGCSAAAIWTGSGFLVDGNPIPILSYGAGPAAWSDELTEVHEEVAGGDHYIDRASREHTIKQLRRWLRVPGATIMDVGCSSGFLLTRLRHQFPDCTIVGADCVPELLERLAKNMPEIPLLQFDLVTCPLADATFDGLVLLNVLEHIEDDLAAARQLLRILKPGGIAVIEVPAGPGLYDVYDRELLHFRRYRMADVVDKLRTAGFDILDRSHLGFFLYPAFRIAKKRNQKYMNADPETRRAVLKRSIARSGNSGAMHAIMRVESMLRNCIYYPVGIRCLVTCRRPA
jgi:SAM-dependent methyltransferase